MKLTSVRVQNYRSIEDSGEVKIEDVTSLVGKNESGKTTFLRALHLLNPLNPIKSKTDFDDTIDYPSKNFSKYKRTKVASPAEVLNVKFELTDSEAKLVEDEFGKGFLTSRTITVSRKYDTSNRSYTSHTDEGKGVKHFLERIEVTATEQAMLNEATTFSELLELLISIEEPNSSVTEMIAEMKGWREGRFTLHLIDSYWEKWLPKFFYFDDYSVMEGRVNLVELQQRIDAETLTEADKTFMSLLKTIDANIADFMSDSDDADDYESLKRELEAASNGITQEVFKYWTQSSGLRVNFDIEPNGRHINIRIWNDRHFVSVPFNERSKGFIWFFSFFAYFSNIDETSSKDLVLLLDEPGLSLHAKAQGDFLKLINEELSPKHTVIYTTHSPFMIEPTKLNRVRTVQDIDNEGTKISEDVLRTDSDTVFPLQAALGYSLAQTLFIGENTLLVEGPSDMIYLQVLSELVAKRGGERLDERWVIVPVGGADKLATFVSLLGANQLNVAVLMDISSKDIQRVDNLKENGYLGKKSVLTFGEFINKKDADIEDLFEEAFYLKLVNAPYKARISNSIKAADIKVGSPRIVLRIGAVLSTLGVPHFNHYLPSSYLLQNQAALADKIAESTTDAASEIFTALNKLVK